MPLRKRLSKLAGDGPADKAEEKKGKRQRFAAFFSIRKQKKAEDDDDVTQIPVPVQKDSPRKPPRDSKIAESTRPANSNTSIDARQANGEEGQQQQTRPTTPPQEPLQKEEVVAEVEVKENPTEQPKEEPKIEPLSEEHLNTLFSGAPRFFIRKKGARLTPAASYALDEDLTVRDVSDSVQLAQPAFSAATLYRHLPVLQQATDQEKQYQGYNLEVVEVPSMLSSQGIEPGTIGFAHFLELPRSDGLATDLQQSQTSNEYLESARNKDLMQNNPERLGIRVVDMSLVYDRLVEFGDLYELFHDSPERMTILNNQSSGDLYANLFGKFLTPPGYDGSVDDPTGMKVQIDTLLKILRLKGVWYDLGLVEWRIRLGQILWGDPEPENEHEAHQIWTERDVLLLQITLACELLLRLDAVTSMEVEDVKGQMHVSPEDYQGFLNLKTKKTAWDMVLARRFLENILVVKQEEVATPKTDQKSRGLLSMLGTSAPKEAVKANIVLLPRHQARQLAGLLHFAQTVQWPGIDLILTDLAQKLGISEATHDSEQMSSPNERFLEPTTPSSISVYGTPLQSPRSNELLDSYFGHLKRPVLSRNNSRSLQVPLSSSTLLAQADEPGRVLHVGGWLSRSYLTGMTLPGEAISHFLMSTLLENDKLAIAALGDSANLYGGFIFGERTWWSKASVVARVLGCLDGAVECMGWVSFTKLPEGLSDGWYAITSDQLRSEQPPRIATDDDLVLRDSAIVPDGDETSVSPADLALPRDADNPPIPAVEFTKWDLTSVNPDLMDNDGEFRPSTDLDTFIASITFKSYAHEKKRTFSLTKDVHFITSWPCTPPASSPMPNLPHILKRSLTQPLSRTSSKRSIHSMKSASNRSSRQVSHRSSHGFEPLLSHPPDSPNVGPTRLHSPVPDEQLGASSPSPRQEPMNAHPLHISYKYKIVPTTEVLDPNFMLPFTMSAYTSPAPSAPNSPREEQDEAFAPDDRKTVLVLDTRASKDLELLARAWCAEKGLHAIVGRVGRTCIACCVREARGVGVNVVIRV